MTGQRATGNGESRREFLRTSALAGAGLVVGFRFTSRAEAQEISTAAADFAPNAYIRIAADGTITLFADHVELGQGITTALPMILADELDADWDTVRLERLQDDPSAWPRPIRTVGSQSVRGSWMSLRNAAAVVRESLALAAAKEWNVDRVSVRTEKGFAIHGASNRRIGYGELTGAAAEIVKGDVGFSLKEPAEFTIIGTKRARADIPAKVNGRAQFGLDVRVPGMLVATVIRPPVIGGKVKSFDPAPAKAVDGVKDVVEFENGVAVLANDTWSALKGRKALVVEWDDGANVALSSAGLRQQYTTLMGSAANVAATRGDPEALLRSSAASITADYELPFAAHATMEPMNCTAHVRADGCEVWASTQGPTGVQQTVAQLLGIPQKSVTVHVMMVGGGFGRKSNNDPVIDAVRLSKIVNAPVKVMWTREDDMQHDRYRPFGLHKLRGAVDASGIPVAWTHRIVSLHALSAGDTMGGASDLPYGIPNFRADYVTPPASVPVQPWRSVGHSQNGFVTESFLDELAVAGKKDPVELRRALLANAQARDAARYAGVLELAVSKSSWGKPMPAGQGRGIAVHAMTGSYVAQIAEVSVVNNSIRVNKVVCAVDCGIVINPDTLASQVEGAIIYGLTCALKNEITVTGGRIDQDNFNTYPMLRINEAPHVEVYTVASTESPGGMGEPGVPPIAAAVGNAVFAATGKRLRKLPFRLV